MIIERSKATAFSVSALLHGGLLMAIFLVAYAVKDLSPTPGADVQPFVMVGVGESHPAPNQPQGVAPSPVNTVSFIPPTPVVVMPTVTTPVEPAVVDNRPSPQAVRDKPHLKPAPVRMTFDHYLALHPAAKPKPASASTPTTVTSGKPTHIDINEVLGNPGAAHGNSIDAPATGSAGANLIDAFYSRLINRLQAAFVKPDGADDALETRVRFHLAADGVLSEVIIVKSSGNRAFDQGVLTAFSKVGSIGPMPTGKGEVLTITFRMIEED